MTQEHSPLDNQPYNKVSEEIINTIIESRRLHYIHSKNLFSENIKNDDESGVVSNEGDDVSMFTNTPHPIGNLPLVSSLILDTISRINNLESRMELGDRKKYKDNPQKYKDALKRYLTDLTYPREHLDAIAGYFGRTNNGSEAERQLASYQASITVLNSQLTKAIDVLETSETLDALFACGQTIKKELKTAFFGIGIPVSVVCPEVQSLQMERKDAWLIQHGARSKTWHGVDGDGDPLNGMHQVRPLDAGQRWEQILQASGKSPSEKIIQPRLSCADNKKDVRGVNTQLHDIPGIGNINTITDICAEERFDTHYAQFKTFLDDQIHSEKLAKDGKKPHLINHPIDFIARVGANELNINSHGLVLSDFDSIQGHYTIIRLMALMKCIRSYSDECMPGDAQMKTNQPILPLAEDYDDIHQIPGVIEKLFDGIKKAYEHARASQDSTKALAALRSLLVTKDGRFTFGVFSGPSDLTNTAGFIATWLLEDSRAKTLARYDAFIEHVPELNLKDVRLPIEYGCGTAPRRGTNVVRPADSTTIQGSAIQETTYDLKQRQRLASLQDLPKEDEPLFSAQFVADAMEAHRTLFCPEGKKGLTAEYNRIIKDTSYNHVLEVVNRQYLNNQGTRGSDGLVEYKNNRAITCASIAALFGFNGCGTPLPTELDEHKKNYNLYQLLNSSAGLKILTDELFQLCTFDRQRLEILGVSQDCIGQLQEYCDAVVGLIAEKLSVPVEPYHSELGYAPMVQKLVTQLITSPAEKLHPITKSALIQFQQQIPVISRLRDGISNAVKMVSGTPSPENLANLGVAVNALANFQGLPKIPEDFNVKIRTNTDQKPDFSLNYAYAQGQVVQAGERAA